MIDASWEDWLAQSVAVMVRQRYCHPTATYRLQFTPNCFTFRDATALTPYLDDLGISHVYASPYLKARSGSAHGYAIIDYGQLNPELGTSQDYHAWVESLHGRGMGQILDTVPNHMSATPIENVWWNDVLENGPASPHAAYFDIDWHPVKEELRNRVLLPILGDQYGQVLEAGELELEYRDGAFFLRYFQQRLPIDPQTYRAALSLHLEDFKASQPADAVEMRELESIITAIEHLPDRTSTDPAQIAERQREKEVIKDRLHALTERYPAIAAFLRGNVREFNGTPAAPHSYDHLDRLLDGQVYRLCHWKAAADEINYRRFFDINELAAVCMEMPEVFAESHRLIFELLVRGDVDGLRVDHIDGLYEPQEYLRHLQRGYLAALGKAQYQRVAETSSPLPGAPLTPLPAWSDLEAAFLARASELTCADRATLPLYVVVEKILGTDETLPEHWLLAGTTGYDFLNCLGGLFVEPTGLEELVQIYSRFLDQRLDFREVVYQSKQLILRTAMSSDLQLLAHRLNRISERHRRSRDFTLHTLRVALREILACFPIYRTYIRPDFVAERDRQVLCRAAAQAKRRNRAISADVFDFVRDVLLLERPPEMDEAGRHERYLFVGRVQQATSPVLAKGIEDTAFYRYFPLASLNEVGGDPPHGATSTEQLHRHNRARQMAWPRSLVCTTTHDTKRSEDVRARISVLSEIPHFWRNAVNRWARLNRRHHRQVDGQPAPSRNDEYFFYQTLVGVWPLAPPEREELRALTDRLTAYMEKATHESKLHTSWINPDPEYDTAVREFVAAVLDGGPKNRFLAEFRRFHEQVLPWGLYSAVSQTLLKLTSPGVPDLYQGQELWDFSLVDPDNRRPVDYTLRRKLLTRLRKDAGRDERALLPLARQLALNPCDPRLKLFLTWRTLQLRRRAQTLFQCGDYLPLEAIGVRTRHVCAFARQTQATPRGGPTLAIVIAPRLFAELIPLSVEAQPGPPPLGPAVWEDTSVVLGSLASGPLEDAFTAQRFTPQDGQLPLASVLADFPVALLTNTPTS